MSYVQQFQPKGNDLEVLRFYNRNRISKDFAEPADQQLVTQQIYDLARGQSGKSAGSIDAFDLDRAYQALIKARAVEAEDRATPEGQELYGQTRLQQLNTQMSGPSAAHRVASPYLLPRTAMQSPLEARRPTRHMNADDKAADAIGAFAYHFIDSATLGIIGGVGGLLKRFGVTDKNFWSEGVGETRNFLGMDFGAEGLAGADSNLALWTSAAGELAGFLGPGGARIIAKPLTGMVKGAVKATAKGTAKKLVTKLEAGAIASELAPQTTKLISALTKGEKAAEIARLGSKAEQGVGAVVAGKRLVEGTEKAYRAVDKIWDFMPARAVFKGGHKALERFTKAGVEKVQARLATEAVGEALDGQKFTRIFGMALGEKNAAKMVKLAQEAAKDASKVGYQTARQTSSRVLASGFQEGVIGNALVNQRATQIFQAKFGELVAKNTVLGKNPKVLSRLMENASQVFEDAFVATRKSGGLLTLAERAAQKGSTGLSLGMRKMFEEAANHATGMVMLGLATRFSHAAATPEIFGIDEHDHMKALGQTVKYWARGNPDGNPLFEGVLGDVWVGSMFGLGGGTKLFKGFQQRRIAKPGEALSIILGGKANKWKGIIDATDRQLYKIYSSIPTKGGGWSVSRFLRRNTVNFHEMDPEDLKVVAKEYLRFFEGKGVKAVPGLMGKTAPFTYGDIGRMGKLTGGKPNQQMQLVADQLTSHLNAVLKDYAKKNLGNMLKDFATFATTATATAYMSNPQLFQEYADGADDIHISSLVTHSIFAGLAARHPYYAPDAPALFAKARAQGQPMSRGMKNQIQLNYIRDGLRRLGVRDSEYFLDDGVAESRIAARPDKEYGPRAATDDLNEIAKEISGDLERADASGQAPAYLSKYRLVTSNEDVVDPVHDITQREYQQIISYVRGEAQRGAMLDDLYMQPDEKGLRPLLDSKDLMAQDSILGAETRDKLLYVAGELKSRLVDRGILEGDSELHLRDIAKANGEWRRRVLDDIRLVLGSSSSGIAADLLKNLPAGFEESRYRKIQIVEKVDGVTKVSDNPEHVQTVEAWNEMVDIFGDTNLQKVDGKKGPFEIRIDSTDPNVGKAVEQIAESIRLFEGEINKRLGTADGDRIRIGDGRTSAFMREAIIETKLDDATFIARMGGTLRDQDGNPFNMDSILDAVVDVGVGRRVDNLIVIPKFSVSEISDPLVRKKVLNLINFLETNERVRVTQHGEVELQADDIKRLLSAPERGIRLEGGVGSVFGKSILDVFESLGLPFSDTGFTRRAIGDADFEAMRFEKDTDKEITKTLFRAGMMQRGPYGRNRVLVPITRGDSEIIEKLEGETLPEADVIPVDFETLVLTARDGGNRNILARFAEALGENNLKLALSDENWNTLVDYVNRNTRSGRLDGFTFDIRTMDGEPVPQGEFSYFDNGQSTSLREIARTLDYVRNRDYVEMEKDMASVFDFFSKNLGKYSTPRRRGIQRLTRALMEARKVGGRNYRNVLQYMVDQGTIRIGKGKRQKTFEIPSTEQALKMAARIESFLEASDMMSALGAHASGRKYNQISREAWEILRGEGSDHIDPSSMFASLGMTKSAMGKAEVITEMNRIVSKAYETDSSDGMIDEARKSLKRLVHVYTDHANRQRAMEIVDEMPTRDLASVMMSFYTKTAMPTWELKQGFFMEERGDVLGDVQGTLHRPKDTGSTRIGHKVTKAMVPKKTWSRLNEIVPVHFVSSKMNGRYVIGEELDRVLTQIKKSFWRGVEVGQEEMPDGTINTHGGRFLLLEKASEDSGFFSFKMPEARELEVNGVMTDRGRLLQKLDQLVDIYAGTVGSKSFADAIAATRRFADALRNTEADLNLFYDGKAENRLDATAAMELLTYDMVFGELAFKDVMRKSTSPDGANAVAKAMAREKLVYGDNIQNVDPMIADAVYKDFLKRTAEITGKSVSMDELARGGITFTESNRIRGMKFLSYDDVMVGETKGRGLTDEDKAIGKTDTSPETDSAIWLTRNAMNALYSIFGRDVIDTTFGVAKIKILHRTEDGGILATKNAMFTDPDMERVMNANGVAGIMSKSAMKLLAGLIGADSHSFRLPDGNMDVKQAIKDRSDGKVADTVEAYEIPIEAFEWQLGVDHDPKSAIVSIQQGNYKDPAVVKALADRYYERTVKDLLPLWEELFGSAVSPDANATLREYYSQVMRRQAEDPDTLERIGWQMSYLASHELASPNHFGMGERSIASMANKFIADTMAKGSSNFGSRGVYAPDLYDSIKPGQIALPHQARKIVLDHEAVGNMAVGFDRPDIHGKDVETLNREYWGWDEKNTHYNTKARGEDVPAQEEAKVQSVMLREGGEKGGIAPGLRRLRDAKTVPFAVAETVDEKGNVTKKRIDAPTMFKLMKLVADEDVSRISGVLNDAFQEAVFTQDRGLALGNAEKILKKKLEGIEIKFKVSEGKDGTLKGSGLVELLMKDLREAHDTAWGKINEETLGQMTVGGLHDALSTIFGHDIYGGESSGIGFGLMTASQRHPSSLQNDLMPMMVRHFLGEEYGQQIRASLWDAERIMKADFDKDEIHFWFDTPRELIGGIQRTRGISSGFREPEMPNLEQFKIFSDHIGESSRREWVRRLSEAKKAIGIVQRGVHIVSNMINKNLSFQWKDENGEVFTVEPIGDMKTIQSDYHQAILDMATRVNQFFDAKKGVQKVALRDMDLQGEVIEKFYRMKDSNGNVLDTMSPEGKEIIKAAMTLFSHTADFTKNVKSFEQLARTASRYKAVIGGNPLNARQRLADYVAISLAQAFPMRNIGSKNLGRYIDGVWSFQDVDKRRADVRANRSLSAIVNSLRVVDPEWGGFNYGSPSLLDTVANGVSKLVGAIEKDYDKSFVTPIERAAISSGRDLMKSWNESLIAADAQRWALTAMGGRDQVKELLRAAEYGEGHLAYEAAATEISLRQSNFWAERQAEADFKEQKRWQPSNGIEDRRADLDMADGIGVELARSLVEDRSPGEAEDRLFDALRIRDVNRDQERRMARGDALTRDQAEVILDAEIGEYMQKYGGENAVAAILDLVAAEPFGYYYRNGVPYPRFKKFPQTIWRIAEKYLPVGPDGQGTASEGYQNFLSGDVYRILASSRAAVDGMLDGDPYAVQEVRSWIEAHETDGRSFTSALNASKLGRFPSRFARMRENIFKSRANAQLRTFMRNEFNGEDIPPLFGGEAKMGFKRVRDSFSFLRAAENGDLDAISRMKILRGKQVNSGIWPQRVLDPISDAESLVMSGVTKTPTLKRGMHDLAMLKSQMSDVRQEQRAAEKEAKRSESKPPKKLSGDDVYDRAMARHRLIIQDLWKTINARYESVDAVNSRGLGKSIVDHMREIDWKERC